MIGSYILVIFLNKEIHIQIGKLGNFIFKNGYYFYIGSALGKYGSSTLENRVKRHLSLSNQKNTHWHIDYLLENDNAKIIKLYLIPVRQNLECIIARELFDLSEDYVLNFGSSDCLCRSHLFFFKNNDEYPF